MRIAVFGDEPQALVRGVVKVPLRSDEVPPAKDTEKTEGYVRVPLYRKYPLDGSFLKPIVLGYDAPRRRVKGVLQIAASYEPLHFRQ